MVFRRWTPVWPGKNRDWRQDPKIQAISAACKDGNRQLELLLLLLLRQLRLLLLLSHRRSRLPTGQQFCLSRHCCRLLGAPARAVGFWRPQAGMCTCALALARTRTRPALTGSPRSPRLDSAACDPPPPPFPPFPLPFALPHATGDARHGGRHHPALSAQPATLRRAAARTTHEPPPPPPPPNRKLANCLQLDYVGINPMERSRHFFRKWYGDMWFTWDRCGVLWSLVNCLHLFGWHRHAWVFISESIQGCSCY